MSVTIDRLDDYLTGGGDPGPLVDTNCAWCLAPLSGDVDEDVELCDGCLVKLGLLLPRPPQTIAEPTTAVAVEPCEPVPVDEPTVSMSAADLFAPAHRAPQTARDRSGVVLAAAALVGLLAIGAAGINRVEAGQTPALTPLPAVGGSATDIPCTPNTDPSCDLRVVPVDFAVTSLGIALGRAAIVEEAP